MWQSQDRENLTVVIDATSMRSGGSQVGVLRGVHPDQHYVA
jgi:hypothetical protein